MVAEASTVPVDATPTETNGAPTPKPPILRRMPFLSRNPPNLSWLGKLGQATIYAGFVIKDVTKKTKFSKELHDHDHAQFRG